MYISLAEYAVRHNRSPVSVRQKAQRGSFKTARRVGRNWVIDENEPYSDLRTTSPDFWLLTNGKRYDTISDAGAIKVGNDAFTVLIPTGAGDGESAFCVCNEDEFDISTATYFTLLSGQFNIYDYDCGNTVAETVEGKFQIYYVDGIVFFVKIK